MGARYHASECGGGLGLGPLIRARRGRDPGFWAHRPMFRWVLCPAHTPSNLFKSLFPKHPGFQAGDSAQGREAGVGLTQGWEMLPISRESKLESLLQDRCRSQAGLWGSPGAPDLLLSCCLRPISSPATWSQPGGGFQAPPLSPFSRCPRASVYRRQKPWLQERNLGVQAESPRHGFQEAPFPRPLRVSHERASGRLQPCQSRPQPLSSRDPPGRPLGPRRRCTRDSPELCPRRQVQVPEPGPISPPQYKPVTQPAEMNFAPL